MTNDSFFQNVLASGGLEAIDELRRERKAHRNVWATPDGTRELAWMIAEGSLFTKLDPADPMEIGRHNMMVDMLDNMGLLDRANMESIVAYMLSLPLIPEGVEAEEK